VQPIINEVNEIWILPALFYKGWRSHCSVQVAGEEHPATAMMAMLLRRPAEAKLIIIGAPSHLRIRRSVMGILPCCTTVATTSNGLLHRRSF